MRDAERFGVRGALPLLWTCFMCGRLRWAYESQLADVAPNVRWTNRLAA